MSEATFINSFMDSLGSTFSGSMLDFLVWLVILGTIGFFAWKQYNSFLVYKYVFLLIDSHGNINKKKARIIKNSKGIRKFKLKEFDDPMYYLSVKEHNGTWNGKPCRIIAWDGMGNLAYTNGIELDKELYLKTALTEIERTEAVDAQMESAEKANLYNKAVKLGTGIAVLVIVMISITLLGVAKFGFENQATFSSAMESSVIASENFNIYAKQMEANTKTMESLISVFLNDNNISLVQELDTN